MWNFFAFFFIRNWRSANQTIWWYCFVTAAVSSGRFTRISPTQRRSLSWQALDLRASARRWSISCTSTTRTESSSPSSQRRPFLSAWMPSPFTTTCGRLKKHLCQRKMENKDPESKTQSYLLILLVSWTDCGGAPSQAGREWPLGCTEGGARQRKGRKRCVCLANWMLKGSCFLRLCSWRDPVTTGSVPFSTTTLRICGVFSHYPVDVFYFWVQHCRGRQFSLNTEPLSLGQCGHFCLLLCCPRRWLKVLPVRSVKAGWHYQFCLEFSFVTGEPLRSPSDIGWPFIHRGTVICLSACF